jgi:hypothetical protein
MTNEYASTNCFSSNELLRPEDTYQKQKHYSSYRPKKRWACRSEGRICAASAPGGQTREDKGTQGGGGGWG